MPTNPIDITFSSLDPSQKNAFQAIDNDSNTSLHIVHGPPGTGKSQLVVSLLERFASEGKKVLFVSQNTEALKVIERMIKRTEKTIGYPTDNKYVSLLDYCLMLYNSNHRHLKYLREQYTRISGKQLPSVQSLDAPDAVQYALNYINLNHDDNYSHNGVTIGFDKLVSYYLKYVKAPLAPEVVRSFDAVDVLGVFHALDSYKNTDYFSQFNQPKRQLILLSTENPNLALPAVRANVKDIQEQFKGQWAARFATKDTVYISSYLNTINAYNQAIEVLDLYKIATEDKEIASLKNEIAAYLKMRDVAKDKLADIDTRIAAVTAKVAFPIEGVLPNEKHLHLSKSLAAHMQDNAGSVAVDRKRIAELTQILSKAYVDLEHIGINDLWVGLAKFIATHYEDVVDDESGVLLELTSDQIDELRAAYDRYGNLGSVKKMVAGVPTAFKDLLSFTNTKQLQLYEEYFRPILDALQPSMRIANQNVGELLAVAKLPSRIPLSRAGIAMPGSIQEASDAFLVLHEFRNLLSKYDIETRDFGATKAQLNDFYESHVRLERLSNVPENKKAFLAQPIEDFVQCVNETITLLDLKKTKQSETQAWKDDSDRSYRDISPYLRAVSEATVFDEKAAEIYEYITAKEAEINSVISYIEVPVDNSVADIDIAAARSLLERVSSEGNFSDYFYELEQGQTIEDWVRSVSALETYNNDAEVVEFIEHNKVISLIRSALGVDNKKFLDEVLANDISFEEFSARIVSLLVGECFGRARITDKKHVTTKDIIDAYDRYLKNQKTISYRENLKYIYDTTLNSTKELSRQSTLQASGKSVMEKFRQNTSVIAQAFPIICATPKDVSKYISPTKALFDYVIFDEASQLLPGQALPALYRAEKAVIIGDPHQMPPSLNASFSAIEQSDDEFDDLGESILDLVLKQPHRQHHLKVHYRSKYNKLFEPSREIIYSSDGIEPIFEAELAKGAPIDIIDDLGEHYDEQGYDQNFYKICETLTGYAETSGNAELCVLFTTLQVQNSFKDFLAVVGERKYPKVSELYGSDKLLISTVTNCQGIEGMYTIIYMHHYSMPGAMWFFKEAAGGYKRLNVAITRQREGLTLLLADQKSHWLQACEQKESRSDTGPNTLQSAKLMKSLLLNAGETADTTYLDRKLGNNVTWFDSPLTEQLYDKLCEHYAERIGRDIKIYSEVGWNLVIPTGESIDANERNVGFRIDLGVFSMKHKKFVLGIEMDGAMYHSGYDKEHSDYTRQKVLEDKGWELYRIWSTNWLGDTRREFSRLTEAIEGALVEG